MRRSLLALAALLWLPACAAEAPERGDADPESQVATATPSGGGDDTAARTAGAEGDPGEVTGSDRCAQARFDATEPLELAEDVPFRIEVPTGWDHLDRSGPSQVSGSVAHVTERGVRSPWGLIQYTVSRRPIASPDVTIQAYRRRMDQVATLDIGGEEVPVFADPGPGVVDARFFYPHGEAYRLASFIFGSATEACMEERRRLRELVLESLGPRG